MPTPDASLPIRFNGHPFLEHFKFLRDLVGDRAIPRQTIPAPAQFYNEMLRGTNCDSLDAVYPTREAFREDLIKAYSDFIHALYEAGCRSLQLDDCTWGMLCDTERRKALYGGQTDADAVAQLYVDLNNAVIDCVPRGMVVNTHICRGNYSLHLGFQRRLRAGEQDPVRSGAGGRLLPGIR